MAATSRDFVGNVKEGPHAQANHPGTHRARRAAGGSRRQRLGTPSSLLTVETARGPLVDRPLDVSIEFENGTKSEVELKTKGPIEVLVQRIVADPGETFGWHSHPGPTIVTVSSGTLTLYHAEDCTKGIAYTAGQSFSNLPHEIHLAKNEGEGDLVIFASYFVPLKTPPVGLRIDQPSPGPGCPL
jgi:quercetin dioxygenase-like cupin family protein